MLTTLRRRYLCGLTVLALFALSACTQLPNTPSSSTACAPGRVACIGDSITFGSGTSNTLVYSYPSQLQRMLGAAWTVGNFGKSGATLMNKGDKPYQHEAVFSEAIAFQPAIVVIMLGTNDTKPQNWKFKDSFKADYRELIGKFKALPTKPRIFICRPVPVIGSGNFRIVEAGIQEEFPMIDQIARDEGIPVIDMHAAFEGKEALIPDRVHPNNDGATVLARKVYQALTGKNYEGEVPSQK